MTDQQEKRDEATGRLTPTQLRIRERCGKVPKHIQQSIDRYRVALGRPPLWSGIQQQHGLPPLSPAADLLQARKAVS